ncbi:aminomethyltransferase folate-binding domain protein [Mycobacterium xenopi 4042]|uniref:Aminomethyltransferase folate-binding domain protein n=1 Tax=Mycobacterium xenopi 4042 TaxID=1299334 RepID=X8DBV4_MYCXE|nr:aminomethyltransferase folate-binding domain protein [Mycobacterium xenopi 4042]
MTEHGPLEDRHRELGANFAEFSGWLMPLSYAGTVSEHNATRNAVGLFDVSHLGKVSVRGPGAARFVNSALTNDLARIRPGKAQYTLCCNESGGVIDDLIAYYISDDEIFLVPNAANTGAVVTVLQAAAPGGVRITNEHRCYAVLAVQGPARLTCSRNWGCRPAWTTWHTPTRRFPASRCGSAAAATPVNMATS